MHALIVIILLLLPAVATAQKAAAVSVDAANRQTLETLQADLPDAKPKWRYIVIHHTASEWSSLKRIDAYHRKKFDDPDGIEYHFLIGNGKKAQDGLIELGRWKLQKLAIHLFKPEGAPDAIAISLVGNLHERKISKAQYKALLALVVALAREHNIPVDNITTHTRVDGRLTVCPGKNFPYKRLIADVTAKLETRTKATNNESNASD